MAITDPCQDIELTAQVLGTEYLHPLHPLAFARWVRMPATQRRQVTRTAGYPWAVRARSAQGTPLMAELPRADGFGAKEALLALGSAALPGDAVARCLEAAAREVDRLPVATRSVVQVLAHPNAPDDVARRAACLLAARTDFLPSSIGEQVSALVRGWGDRQDACGLLADVPVPALADLPVLRDPDTATAVVALAASGFTGTVAELVACAAQLAA